MIKPYKLRKLKKPSVDWERVIALSAAAHYIQNEINEELKNIKEKDKK